MQELEIKLDNLDARDMRQLNEVYAEVKRVEGMGTSAVLPSSW